MWAALKRHPLPVVAHFDFSLVLAYAVPAPVLAPLLPPGLELDLHGDLGFVAVAMVQTRRLRPAFLPRFTGVDFFLAGYRIFVRCRPARLDAGRCLRGLYILRSDTDRGVMQRAGNVFTHYRYHLAQVQWERRDGDLYVRVRTPSAAADVDVTARLGVGDAPEVAPMPDGSPFRDWREARRFAGPLPFTFGHEPATGSLVRVEGVRGRWQPRPVAVTVRTLSFLARPPFADAAPRLASAFFLEDVPYRWSRGIRERVTAGWRA